VTDAARHATSVPGLAAATGSSAGVHDYDMAWFDKVERDLMLSFDNARQNLQ